MAYVKSFKCTTQRMKFSIKDFSSKCDLNWRRSHLLEKFLTENFIFCAESTTA